MSESLASNISNTRPHKDYDCHNPHNVQHFHSALEREMCFLGTCYDGCGETHEQWKIESEEEYLSGILFRQCLRCKQVYEQRYHHGLVAYCKYCYESHVYWVLGGDWGSEIVWLCFLCGASMHDIHMDIRKGE